MSFRPQIRFRAYIGPLNVAANDPSDIGKWDWITDCIRTEPIPPQFIGTYTLAANMSPSSATFVVTGGAMDTPEQAGIWIGPNASGEGWEYIPYSESGSITARAIPVGQSGYHTAGAKAYIWYPLDNNIGQLQWDQEQSDNMSTITWTAKLSGVAAPATVLKPEHLILVTYSYQLGASDSEYYVLFAGLIERVTMSQDYNLQGKWDIDIVSTSRILQDSQIPGLRIGGLNVALQAEAEASSSLGANWKLTLPQMVQVQSGSLPEIDLVDLQSDCGPQNMLDGNDNTLWVSDGWVGPPSSFGNVHSLDAWANLFCNPVPSQPYGSKYLEIINQDNLPSWNIYVYAKWTLPDSSTKARWYKITEDNFFDDMGLEDDSINGAEDRLIIAEDLAIFQKLFPAAKAKYMFDGSTFSGNFDRENPRRLWWEGGAIFVHWDTGMANGRKDMFHWGAVTYGELETAWDAQALASFDLPSSNFYLNTAGIRPGMVFRRNFADDATGVDHMSFIMDYMHYPGYVISNDINADDNDNPSKRSEWVKVVLPEMSHILARDINNTTTTIYVIDAQNAPNVEGISKHGHEGVIIIDDEAIPFTGKDYLLGTLTGCTVVNKHKAGSRVYVRWNITAWGYPNVSHPSGYQIPEEGKVHQVASNAYPIEKFEWGRGWYTTGVERFPCAGNYVVRFSVEPDAPNPTVDSYDNGYINAWTIDATSFTPSVAVANPVVYVNGTPFGSTEDGFRPRTILMQFRSMNDATGAVVTERPRLNYFRAWVDRSYFNPDTWLDIDTDAIDNEVQIITAMKLSGHFESFFQEIVIPDIVRAARIKGITDRDTAWRVATDMADFGESVIRCERYGTLSVYMNTFLLSEDHPAVRSYTDSDLASLEIVNIRPAEVGQIKLTWEHSETAELGTVYYPADVRPSDNVVEIGPMLADSQEMATLIATNLYNTKRYPYNVFIELAASNMDIAPGEVHQIQSDFLRNGQITTKYLLSETVSQIIADGSFSTQIGYREIGRTTL